MNASALRVIHAVNLIALLLFGVILLFAGFVKPADVVLLLPIPVLIGIYWRFRANPKIAAVYLGLSIAVLSWILLCENVVAVDNLLGSRITKQLTLGGRLQIYADTKLDTAQRDAYLQPCCDDPLSWHYRPGSTYRVTFDCETCNAPYEVVIDETGYVNRAVGLMASHEQIDMFVAGDSVLQGLGVPSVMEFLRDQLPVTMWNLSIAGYGPRQKISALITYALPKHPKWLVVEFYPNNDVSDAIVADVCKDIQDFRYCYWTIERAHRIMKHPVYHTMVDTSNDIFEILEYYAAQNFTLATTRYIIAPLRGTLYRLKGALKRRLTLGIDTPVLRSDNKDHLKPHRIKFVNWVEGTHLHREKLLDWVIASMPLVFKNYERLVVKMTEMERKPQVILLYHPTSYEIYHGILTDRNDDYDRIAEHLKAGQRDFAKKHGWVFLDLTIPLRNMLQTSKMWLYGRHDPYHWSLQGTTLVASVLRAELLRVIAGD